MRRAPIRIRTFILGAILVLLLVPTLAGAVGWLIENDRQQAAVRQRLNSATDYLSSHGTEMGQPIVVEGFARLLGRLGLRAQVTLIANTPPAKVPLYTSPELVGSAREFKIRRATNPELSRLVPVVPTTLSTTWPHSQRQIPVGPSRKAAPSLTADLYYPPTSSATRALVALLTAVIVLFAGLAVVVWLTGRWMVTPLTRLSAEVDKVAGGHLTIAIPRSRIGEIENIAQAVEGMTTALGETAQRRTEADQARQFLVTGIAHDLRTPLFALRGHLQAIGSRLGNPSIHLERAEARADALEHLIGNLFAYTRDDYAQPAVQLQAIHVADLLREVTAGVEHAARLGDITFELDGDRATAITADRDRLKRALTNILDNAIRHSPPGATIQLSWIDPRELRRAAHHRRPRARDRFRPPAAHLRTRRARQSGTRPGRHRSWTGPHDRQTPARNPARDDHDPQPARRRRPGPAHPPANPLRGPCRALANERRHQQPMTRRPVANTFIDFSWMAPPAIIGCHDHRLA